MGRLSSVTFDTDRALETPAHEKPARGYAAFKEAGFLRLVAVIMAKITHPFREKSLPKRKVPRRAGETPENGQKFA